MIETDNGEYSYSYSLTPPPADGVHRHMHNGYEILYFLDGDAEYIIEGSVYRLLPRTLLLIRPRTFHYLNPLSNSEYKRCVIHFPVERIPPTLLQFAHTSKEIFRIPKGSLVDAYFKSWIYAEEHFSTTDLETMLFSSLGQLLLYLKYLPDEDTVVPMRENRTLERILRYIDEHPGEQITAAMLSAKFYVSTSWIVHSFRRHLGISLMQYVNKKRILYAESRIREGMAPTEVAKECHYDSYVTFYRQYKKYLGRSPQANSV